MISYTNFRFFLEKQLLEPLFIVPQFYQPHYSTNIKDFTIKNLSLSDDFNGNCIFCYEEPLNFKDLSDLSRDNRNLYIIGIECRDWKDCEIPSHGPIMYDVNFKVFANSEKSDLKKQWLKSNAPFLDWYFFFHGFAALDWFRDYNYIQNINNIKISKVFICLNHNINYNRSYRMLLLSALNQNNLFDQGIISAPLLTKSIIDNEIYDSDSKLTVFGKKHINKNLRTIANPLIIDDINYSNASASIPDFCYKALWHVVTETNFYDEKLHLTEKIFKPIVIKRPFILVSAPKNLEYLKSYGFKTFDRWIDESYDNESDHDLRLKMIVKEIKKLCKMSKHELDNMYKEMNYILEFNHTHFFTDFKKIIVNELVDNFESCTKIYNRSLSERFQLPVHLLNFHDIKQKMLR